MNTINPQKELASQLETLVSHVNDSIKGFEKAAEKSSKTPDVDSHQFLAMKSARENHAIALNSRLQCIGEDWKSDGSIKGAAHRALISVKDLFTDSNSSEAICEEALRGESKLLEYVDETLSKLDAIDPETRKAIADLKGDIVNNRAELKRACGK
ncbi:DUF2383 domain-containing protein [Pelagicoccus sp. SDUM812005]|uniref:DUF2383 domain-containing protein n=1 Tax=Pelagicoccus sp. SDUM812005 TaxID=3041257 RepID=UPI00280C98DC|nr:DUF2383 domain-containing protein [Pelagicoccus sp. SDUM812005]MDQ8181053.1 DUF2383 domain-containing protein [Pelagicoccus sp. SDUM812005]